jgi:hypothetical protein
MCEKKTPLTMEEIDVQVKAAIGFESLGFYEHKNYDRKYRMFKKSGEVIYEVEYEFFPKGILELLNFNWMHYNLVLPQVNRVLMAVLNGANYTDSHGRPMTADLYEITLLDSVENVNAMGDFLQTQHVAPFIEEGALYGDRLVKGCAAWRQAIDQFVLPFFKTYTSMQHVHDQYIEITPWDKVGSRMNVNPVLKRMIILKLCGNPNYEAFTNNFAKRLADLVQQGMREYESYHAALVALKAYLDEGKYMIPAEE